MILSSIITIKSQTLEFWLGSVSEFNKFNALIFIFSFKLLSIFSHSSDFFVSNIFLQMTKAVVLTIFSFSLVAVLEAISIKQKVKAPKLLLNSCSLFTDFVRSSLSGFEIPNNTSQTMEISSFDILR